MSKSWLRALLHKFFIFNPTPPNYALKGVVWGGRVENEKFVQQRAQPGFRHVAAELRLSNFARCYILIVYECVQSTDAIGTRRHAMEAAAARGVSEECDYGDEWNAPPTSGTCCSCEGGKHANMIGQRGGRLAMTKWRGKNLCNACRSWETRAVAETLVSVQLLGKAAYKSHYHRFLLAFILEYTGQ